MAHKLPDFRFPPRDSRTTAERVDEVMQRVAELRERYPAEDQGRVLSDVAYELGVSYRTVARLYQAGLRALRS